MDTPVCNNCLSDKPLARASMEVSSVTFETCLEDALHEYTSSLRNGVVETAAWQAT